LRPRPRKRNAGDHRGIPRLLWQRRSQCRRLLPCQQCRGERRIAVLARARGARAPPKAFREARPLQPGGIGLYGVDGIQHAAGLAQWCCSHAHHLLHSRRPRATRADRPRHNIYPRLNRYLARRSGDHRRPRASWACARQHLLQSRLAPQPGGDGLCGGRSGGTGRELRCTGRGYGVERIEHLRRRWHTPCRQFRWSGKTAGIVRIGIGPPRSIRGWGIGTGRCGIPRRRCGWAGNRSIGRRRRRRGQWTRSHAHHLLHSRRPRATRADRPRHNIYPLLKRYLARRSGDHRRRRRRSRRPWV